MSKNLINEDVFNRHIYQDEVVNIKAKEVITGDILVIQKRAYEVYRIVELSQGNLMFAFRQGVMIQCMGDSTQQKFRVS